MWGEGMKCLGAELIAHAHACRLQALDSTKLPVSLTCTPSFPHCLPASCSISTKYTSTNTQQIIPPQPIPGVGLGFSISSVNFVVGLTAGLDFVLQQELKAEIIFTARFGYKFQSHVTAQVVDFQLPPT